MKLILESRTLFDGSVAIATAAAADVSHSDSQAGTTATDATAQDKAIKAAVQDTPAAAQVTVQGGQSEARQIVFIDQKVEGWQSLADASAATGAHVVVLDPGRDAITQITEALAGQSGVTSLQILSHGSAGTIEAGRGAITSATLADQAAEVASWRDHLAEGADILIWGCDVGAGDSGTALLTDLHNLTGADVAASTDDTGAASLGGDWVLEASTGRIETGLPADRATLEAYQTLMAAPTITDTTPSSQTRQVDEDHSLTFDNQLTISGTGTLTVTVTLKENNQTPSATIADGGTFSLNGTTGLSFSAGDGVNDATMTFTGTAADINAALAGLVYRPTDNFNGNAKFSLTVVDGSSLSASADIAVQVVTINDVPNFNPLPVGNAGVARVNEGLGNTVTLTAAQFGIDTTSLATLGAFDADLNSNLSTVKAQTTDQITFEVTSVPVEGRLLKNGNPLLAGSLFTLADLIAGKITYEHLGSQANEALLAGSESDSFNVTVRDGAGGVDTGTVAIKIVPVDQAPVVTAAPDPAVIAYEGRLGVPIVVSVTDVDQVSTTYTFAFNNLALPAGNVLYLDINGDGKFSVGDTQIVNGFVWSGTVIGLNNLLRLDVSDAEPTTALTFKLSVTDDDGGTHDAGATAGDGTTTIQTITINPVENNDYPVLTTNVSYVGSVGTWWVTMTSAMLRSTDTDSPDSNLTYVVTGPVTLLSGDGTAQIQMNGQALGVGSTFTQADITAGAVSLVFTGGTHDSSTVQQFSFNFKVYDGELTAFSTVNQTVNSPAIEGGIRDAADSHYVENSYIFSFTPGGTGPGVGPAPVNVAPVVAAIVGISAADLSEGGTVTVGGNFNGSGATTGPRIAVTDTDNTSSEIVFRLESVPTGGTVLLNGVAIAQFGSFTMKDLLDGKVTYRQDGGEQFLSANLGFSFSVSDGQAAVTPAATDGAGHNFRVEARPVNDTPEVSVDQSSTVAEGGSVAFNTVGQSTITLTDVDGSGDAGPSPLDNYLSSGSDQLYVVLGSLPQYGTLSVNGGAALVIGSHVLKSDIQAGKLVYTHDGSENFTDSFMLTANDAQGQSNSTGNTITVNIKIAPVNDSPTTDAVTTGVIGSGVNTGLRITEGTTGVIGGSNAAYGGTAFYATTDGFVRSQLISYDPDNSASQIQYRITTDVVYGKLLLNGQVLGVGSTFTQADLDAGRVTYVHNGDNGNGQGAVSDYFEYQVGDAGPGVYPTGKFDIEVWTTANDTPVIAGPSASTVIEVDTPSTATAITGFSLTDSDFSMPTDPAALVQVTVRLTSASGTPLSSADYAGYTLSSSVGGSGASVDSSHGGVNDCLVLRGTVAQINAYLAGLQLATTTDPNSQLKLEVVADDRTRNGSGTLTSGANGGTINQNNIAGGAAQAISTAEFNPYSTLVSSFGGYNVVSKTVTVRVSTVDETPTVTVPTSQTVAEDVKTRITGISVNDPESVGFGVPTTVTLTVGAGKIEVGTQSGVTISGSGTGTVTLTGTVGNINTLLAAGVYYTSPTNDHTDHNGGSAGDVTLTVSITESTDASVGTGGGSDPSNNTVSNTVDITVTPVNDAPVVTQTSTMLTLTDGVTAAAVSGFVVSDVDISGDGGVQAGESDFIQVTIRLLDGNYNPLPQSAYAGVVLATSAGSVTTDTTYTGSGAALRIRGTLADVNAALASLTLTPGSTLYTNWSANPAAYRIQVIADDRIRDPATGALDSSGIDANGGELNNSNGSTSAQAVPTTEFNVYSGAAPTIYNLDAGNQTAALQVLVTPTVNEDVRTYIGGHFVITDYESDTYNLPVRVTLSTGGMGTLGVGGIAIQNGGTIAGVTIISGDETGTLLLEGTARAIQALLNDSANGLHYQSAADDNIDHNAAAAGDVTITVTLNEYRSATDRGDTADIRSTSFGVTVNPVNDAPTVTVSTPYLHLVDDHTTVLVSGFSVADVDISGDSGNLQSDETDFLQVTIRLLGAGGTPLSLSDYAGVTLVVDAAGSGVSVDTAMDGNGAALRIRGTLAEINAALASLTMTPSTNLFSTNPNCLIQVIADDRVRDLSTGALDSSGIDANGGELNNSDGSTSAQAVPTTEFDVYADLAPSSVYNLGAGNQKAVLSLPVSKTVDEDAATNIGGGFDITDHESDTYNLPIRVTLSTGGRGILGLGSGTAATEGTVISTPGGNVTVVSGDESGTLLLEGKASAIKALLNDTSASGLHYQSALNDNADHNGTATGDVTITVTIDEYQSATGLGVSPQVTTGTFGITINPVNDAPVLAGTLTNPTAQGTALGAGPVALLSGASVTDVDFGDSGVTTFGHGVMTVHLDAYRPGDVLSLPTGLAGVASISGGNGTDLVITLTAGATPAQVSAILAAVRYASTSADPTQGGTAPVRTYSISLMDGNNDDDSNNAGGPAALSSNVLTGQIAFSPYVPPVTPPSPEPPVVSPPPVPPTTPEPSASEGGGVVQVQPSRPVDTRGTEVVAAPPVQPQAPVQSLYTTPSQPAQSLYTMATPQVRQDQGGGSETSRDIFSKSMGDFVNRWDAYRQPQLELMLVASVSNRFIIPLQPATIEVPPDIFRHSNPNENLTYEARRPDGSALPNWLTFDARALTFRGTPPNSARGPVDIVIVAKDTLGNQAEAQFRILVGQNVGDQAPVQEGTGQPDGNAPPKPKAAPPGAGRSGTTDAPPETHQSQPQRQGWLDHSRPLGQPDGRTAFSSQMRDAGAMGILAKARSLLTALSQHDA